MLDPGRGIDLETKPVAGAYAFELDQGAASSEAQLVIEGPRGAMTTLKLAIAPTTTSIAVEPLAIWHAPVEVKREADRVRFAWPPLEGAQGPLRYSLLITYDSDKGQFLDAALVTKGELFAVQTLAELEALMPELDPKATAVQVRIRAYSATSLGPVISGEPLTWPLPDELRGKK